MNPLQRLRKKDLKRYIRFQRRETKLYFLKLMEDGYSIPSIKRASPLILYYIRNMIPCQTREVIQHKRKVNLYVADQIDQANEELAKEDQKKEKK